MKSIVYVMNISVEKKLKVSLERLLFISQFKALNMSKLDTHLVDIFIQQRTFIPNFYVLVWKN